MFHFHCWTLRATAFASTQLAFLVALTLLASCGETTLDLDDLTPAEREFVTRFDAHPRLCDAIAALAASAALG